MHVSTRGVFVTYSRQIINRTRFKDVETLGSTSRLAKFLALGQLSPDGTEASFTALPWKKIEILRGDGLVATLPVPGQYEWLNAQDWSPDGRWLLVDTIAGDQRTARALRRDGSEEHPLFQVPSIRNGEHRISQHWELGRLLLQIQIGRQIQSGHVVCGDLMKPE